MEGITMMSLNLQERELNKPDSLFPKTKVLFISLRKSNAME